MHNKKLLITSFYPPYIIGGAEISNSLLAEGLKMDVLTLGVDSKVEIIKEVRVDRIYVSQSISNYLKSIIESKKDKKISKIYYKIKMYYPNFKIHELVKFKLKDEYKLVHTSGISYIFGPIWWKYAKIKNKKTIHTLRDNYMINSSYVRPNNILIKIFDIFHRNYYINYLEKYVDYVHSPTKYMIDLHIKNGFKIKNTKVIPNTVEMGFELTNYKNKTYDIIYVGSLSKTKGIKTLIELKKLKPELKITLVGSGELESEALKVGIKCTGWLEQDKVFNYMKKSKIVILPSEWEEAFGRVLIEGVACGTISIGSNMGGIPEVLFNDSRYIFEARNVSDLKNKIERVLKLDEDSYMSEVLDLQKRMEIYKYENHIKQFEEFYDEVLRK